MNNSTTQKGRTALYIFIPFIFALVTVASLTSANGKEGIDYSRKTLSLEGDYTESLTNVQKALEERCDVQVDLAGSKWQDTPEYMTEERSRLERSADWARTDCKELLR